MSKRNDDLLIEDIISSCNKILNYTKDFSEETFKEDDNVFMNIIARLATLNLFILIDFY